MRKISCALASAALILGLVPAAFAQNADPESLPSKPVLTPFIGVSDPDRMQAAVPYDTAELTQWTQDFAEWKKWVAAWGNRRERGWFTRYRERHEKPAPPAWLPMQCELDAEGTDLLATACVMLGEWRDEAAAQARLATAAAIAQKEDLQKTIWWEHIHMDVMWPSVQWQANTYGVIGMHATTTVTGRLEMFIAPGAMLLNLPTRSGDRTWKVATNYGIAFRLFDFAFPGNRRAVLHLNLAKSWLISDISDVIASRSMDFSGFSLTFRKPR